MLAFPFAFIARLEHQGAWISVAPIPTVRHHLPCAGWPGGAPYKPSQRPDQQVPAVTADVYLSIIARTTHVKLTWSTHQKWLETAKHKNRSTCVIIPRKYTTDHTQCAILGWNQLAGDAARSRGAVTDTRRAGKVDSLTAEPTTVVGRKPHHDSLHG